MLIYAHRGSSGVEPENTLAAFARAIADGADGVELDLRATADGVPVVLHDRDLGRTTTGRGNVDELTLAELRRVDAGDGRPVPTLVEVLDLLAGHLRLDLEVKQAGIERAILDDLAAFARADWAISSFDWDVLRAVRALASAAELWPLAVAADDALFAVAREVGATAVALLGTAATSKVVERCAAADLGVVVWTVNRVEDARLARDFGATALCTDLPAAIRAGLTA